MAAMGRAEVTRSQEPGSFSYMGEGAQEPEPSSSVFPGRKQGACSEMEQLRLEWLEQVPIWDAGTVGGSLVYYTMVLAALFYFIIFYKIFSKDNLVLLERQVYREGETYRKIS